MRKELDYQADYGRDAGKMFRITEMGAVKAEKWCLRAFFTLLNAKVDLPEEITSSGFAGLMSLGLDAFSRVPYEAAVPLWDELMEFNASIMISSIGMTYVFSKGYFPKGSPMPAAKKIMQPRKFRLEFNKIYRTPI